MLRKTLTALCLSTLALSAGAVTPKSLPDRMVDSLASSMKVVYLDGRPDSEAVRRAAADSLREKIAHFY
ncbi:MAG: hypothetical protein K2H87_01955, partial [Duncaniella sp.]|nr:hypothetical protein [Duncaniella sp.]